MSSVLAVVQDITERKREEARLRQIAMLDPLTGALNRSGFDQRLARMASRVNDGDETAALL